MRKFRAAQKDRAVQFDVVLKLLTWFSREAREMPWRRTADPYAIWVSEVMLQQTQVATVIPYWNRWMIALPNTAALARAAEQDILKLWEGLGYYSRARNLQRAAIVVERDHSGIFPNTFDQIRALPGIGDYTAGAICSIVFNQPTPAVDGNVIRVLSRIHGVPGDPKGPELRKAIRALTTQWMQLAASIERPAKACGALTEALMELGATVCLPRNPRCNQCPIQSACFACSRARTSDFPTPSLRASPIQKRFAVLVLQGPGGWLARQRPAKVVNAGLWEFPNFELPDDRPRSLKNLLKGLTGTSPRPWFRLKHSITKYRIALEVLYGEVDARFDPTALSSQWISTERLTTLPFTSAHRKIARKLPPD